MSWLPPGGQSTRCGTTTGPWISCQQVGRRREICSGRWGGRLSGSNRSGRWSGGGKPFSGGWRPAVDYHLLSPGMVVPKEAPRVPRYLRTAEVANLRLVCTTQRDMALIGLFVDAGPRLGEVAGMSRRDLNTHGAVVRGKAGERFLPLTARTLDMLRSIGGPDHLFIGRQGPIGYWHLARITTGLLRAAGIEKGGPHVLRHTFAVHFLRSGGDLVTLQAVLGHRDLATTRRYLELAREDIVKTHRKHSPANFFYGSPLDSQEVSTSRARPVEPHPPSADGSNHDQHD